jgi:hypothetical protein
LTVSELLERWLAEHVSGGETWHSPAS